MNTRNTDMSRSGKVTNPATVNAHFLPRLKSRLKRHRLVRVGRDLQLLIRKHFAEVCSPDRQVVSLAPAHAPKGYVLLSYILEPFLLKAEEGFSIAHTNNWESLQIAKTFVELGYGVDVIEVVASFNNWPNVL